MQRDIAEIRYKWDRLTNGQRLRIRIILIKHGLRKNRPMVFHTLGVIVATIGLLVIHDPLLTALLTVVIILSAVAILIA